MGFGGLPFQPFGTESALPGPLSAIIAGGPIAGGLIEAVTGTSQYGRPKTLGDIVETRIMPPNIPGSYRFEKLGQPIDLSTFAERPKTQRALEFATGLKTTTTTEDELLAGAKIRQYWADMGQQKRGDLKLADFWNTKAIRLETGVARKIAAGDYDPDNVPEIKEFVATTAAIYRAQAQKHLAESAQRGYEGTTATRRLIETAPPMLQEGLK